MEFDLIQGTVFKEYSKNGYHKMWSRGFKTDIHSQEQRVYDISEIALVGTEISELIERIRAGENEMDEEYCFELADIIIRTLNFATRKGIRVEHYILKKNGINLEREKLHGKEV